MTQAATRGDSGQEKMCYWHEEYQIVVHCFGPGECRCLCGKVIVRKQIRRSKIGNFGRGRVMDFTS